MSDAPSITASVIPAARTGFSRRMLVAVALAIALILPAIGAGTARADAETEGFIRGLGDKAVGQLTGSDISDADRAERFRSLLLSHFDVPKIGQYVLGRYWRVATPEEQSEYLALFEEFLVRSYSQRFSEYTGEKFEVASSRANGDLELVRSYVVTRNGEKAKLDWILERSDNGLMIVDLKVEGLSLSETHRSEFASVIQNNGGKVAGLIEALRKKVGA